MRRLAEGDYELGQIRLNSRERTVSFPAKLNLTNGLVEYLLVTSNGKTHESILTTEVAPAQIHVAMLLLGVKAPRTNSLPEDPGMKLPGHPVRLEVSWSAGDKRMTRAMEELVFNLKNKAVMSKGSWVYNGSFVADGQFAASLSGSIVSLITDAEALVNNPRPGRENDDIWSVNSRRCPPADLPLTITIRLHQ